MKKLAEINDNAMSKCIEGGEAVDIKYLKDRLYKQKLFKPKDVSLKAYNLKVTADSSQYCRQY